MKIILLCVLGLFFLQAVTAKTLDCYTDDDNDVDGQMKDCCKKADGDKAKLIINKDLHGVYPFQFHCDNSELEVLAGVTLKSSTNEDRFKDVAGWIMANDYDDITLVGSGIIDGSGKTWWDGAKNLHTLFHSNNVNNLYIKDLNFQNAPKQTIVVDYANGVTVRNITVNNPADSDNTDCLDFTSENVFVTDCTLNCGDDNVAIKDPSSNIYVQDCDFGSGHGASIGSVLDNTVKNVTFTSISFKDTTNGARIKTYKGYSGGKVEDISFLNFKMDGIKYPMVIKGLYSQSSAEEKHKLKDFHRWSKPLQEKYWERMNRAVPGPESSSADITRITYTNINADDSQHESSMSCNPDNECTEVHYDTIDLEPSKLGAVCEYIKDSTYRDTTPSELYDSKNCDFKHD